MEQGFEEPIQREREERRRRSLKTALIVIIVLFGMSVILNVIFILAVIGMAVGAGASETGMVETVIDEGQPGHGKILLIRIDGVIVRRGGFSGNTDSRMYIKKRLEAAQGAESEYRGVLLVVNSPGGGVTESDEILGLLKQFRKKTGKPVVAYFQNVAASGGYYISAGCDNIIAHPTAVTGSIGVIMTFIQAEALMDKIGVDTNVIVSSRTPFKDIGSPFRKMKDTERSMLQAMVEEIYGRFVDVVAEGRKTLTRKEVLDCATGMIYSGKEALKKKLVDNVGSFDTAAKTVRKLAGAPKAQIVELRSRQGLIQSLLSAQSKKVSIEVFSLEKLAQRYNGQPLYLWMPGSEK